uniref:Uncharacterized protein n=1 Tax=Ditylenchus dipsaci TaxID=166011 RepID=A0A915CNR4_9BILA
MYDTQESEAEGELCEHEYSHREEFIRAVPLLGKICKVRQSPSSNHRPRIITDGAPARARRNCGDNVKNRKHTFSSLFSTPTSHQKDSVDSKKSSNARNGSIEMQPLRGDKKFVRGDRKSLTVNPLRHPFKKIRRTKSASVVVTQNCLPNLQPNDCEERTTSSSFWKFGIARRAKLLL